MSEGREKTYLIRPSPHMRHQHHIRIPQQSRMNLGLFLKHIQTRRKDFAAIQGFDESGLVDDCASRCVDDDNAVFHFCEFGFADDVVCVFLHHISFSRRTHIRRRRREGKGLTLRGKFKLITSLFANNSSNVTYSAPADMVSLSCRLL